MLDVVDNKTKLNYVNLRLNGKLFPIWVMQNFKKYKLPELFKGEDGVQKLREYQEFVSKFLDYNSIYKSILLYHGVGTGKTATAINIYNMLFNYTPAWNVIVILKATLHSDNWNYNKETTDLYKWLEKSHLQERLDNMQYVHYDSPIADKQFLDIIRNSDSSKKNLFIMDECHNFIKNVYNNIITRQSQKALKIYDYIVNEKKNNPETRVVLMSATPAINDPYELSLLFNLLSPDCLPSNEQQFNEIFVKDNKLNPERKNLFQRRILGLVSYYIGTDQTKYARRDEHKVKLIMSEYQTDVYKTNKLIEDNKAISYKGKNAPTYKTYTRQAVNFVFPNISNQVNAGKRPRPSNFKLNEQDVELLDSNKSYRVSVNKTLIDAYLNTTKLFLTEFEVFINKIDRKDFNKDIEEFKNTNESVDDYFKRPRSKLMSELYKYSCKMTVICLYTFRSKGTILIYSNYVLLEGLQILKVYLDVFGYSKYNNKPNPMSYVEYHGGIDQEMRKLNKDKFNDPKNLYGDYIKILLLSPSGAEGLSLKNVRQLHILEPYWTETRLEQVIGRAIRMYSHDLLDPKERYVDIYKYEAIQNEKVSNKNELDTTDTYVYNKAHEKQELINSFLDAVKESAVDCELNSLVNMKETKYNCFKFNEESYFDEYPTPAFKLDIDQDMKLDSGLNSVNSYKTKIKTYKIKAVVKKDGKYTTPVFYWYSPETNVIYDLSLKYPVGKLLIDENKLPSKLSVDVYVIDKLIDIPFININ